jgi:hypothetical protein
LHIVTREEITLYYLLFLVVIIDIACSLNCHNMYLYLRLYCLHNRRTVSQPFGSRTTILYDIVYLPNLPMMFVRVYIKRVTLLTTQYYIILYYDYWIARWSFIKKKNILCLNYYLLLLFIILYVTYYKPVHGLHYTMIWIIIILMIIIIICTFHTAETEYKLFK